MSTKILLLSLLFTFGIRLYGQVSVRLFTAEKPQSVLVRVSSDGYSLKADGLPARELIMGDMILVGRAGEMLAVNVAGDPGFLADTLVLLPPTDESFITLSVPGRGGTARELSGSFIFYSALGVVRPVNSTGFEHYIAGVVQAEGGYNGHLEYKKSQAVIARTYAMMHLDRHSDEGYQLCDDTHCQVYRGRAIVPDIIEAVASTAGEVIAGSDSILLFTPFHSNCGGETVTADWVWLTHESHLVSIIDPYCSFSRNAAWEQKVAKSNWNSFLLAKGVNREQLRESYHFSQPARMQFMDLGGVKIPLSLVRNEMGLRSSFFSVMEDGESLLLKGRGYGHGVGLCQEGAMVMATRGYTYRQILGFYYSGIILIDVSAARIEEDEIVHF